MHPSKKMNAAELDDHEKGKLFVGGLSWETTQENLQRYFGRYGEVIDCVVMKNNETGRSRGFGFVTFADPDNVERALENGPHTLDGRTIDPKPCNPRSLHKPKRTGGYPKVFLGGLPPNITETDLRSFFSRYGNVMEVVIMYDQEKKKSRGFGFLSFENEAAVERATAEHFVNISGKQVEIKKAEPRDGSGNNNSMNTDSYQWGSPQAPPMGNGQMGGPPINMQSNMMQGYQGWGASQPQQGYGGYGASAGAANAYQGWGAPPPQQWGNYNATPQQTQGYGGYDMYNSSGAGSAGGYAPEIGTRGICPLTLAQLDRRICIRDPNPAQRLARLDRPAQRQEDLRSPVPSTAVDRRTVPVLPEVTEDTTRTNRTPPPPTTTGQGRHTAAETMLHRSHLIQHFER